MNGRRAVIGLCMLCALIVSAVAAPGAQAETTAFTCTTSAEKKEWNDEHCNGAKGGSVYGHETIAENTTTDLSGGPGTSKNTQRLKATINGITTELLTEGGITGEGSMHNAKVGGKMVATGTGTITYTGVEVAKPAEKGCEVYTDTAAKEKGEKGVIHTNELKAQTNEAMGLNFEPVAGSFANFIIAGCKGSEALEGLNGTYEVTGSVIGIPNGGETVFEHTTTTNANTLKLNGSIKAGIEGSLTIKGKHHEKVETPKALTVTTPGEYV